VTDRELEPGALIGRTLSRHRIDAALGAGGMGEVYRATDTTLDRDVAIKVLPAAFASDPERLARFEREAKLRCRPSARPPRGDRPRRGRRSRSLRPRGPGGGRAFTPPPPRA
jgi:hypothetical protein